MPVNKFCPNDVFKIMFDNDFLITLVVFTRKRIVILVILHCL